MQLKHGFCNKTQVPRSKPTPTHLLFSLLTHSSSLFWSLRQGFCHKPYRQIPMETLLPASLPFCPVIFVLTHCMNVFLASLPPHRHHLTSPPSCKSQFQHPKLSILLNHSHPLPRWDSSASLAGSQMCISILASLHSPHFLRFCLHALRGQWPSAFTPLGHSTVPGFSINICLNECNTSKNIPTIPFS